jgi:hypothetical protein
VAEGDGLLNRCTALKPYRGFESLRLRFSFIDNQRFRKVIFKNLKDLKLFSTKLELTMPKNRQFFTPNYDFLRSVNRILIVGKNIDLMAWAIVTGPYPSNSQGINSRTHSRWCASNRADVTVCYWPPARLRLSGQSPGQCHLFASLLHRARIRSILR